MPSATVTAERDALVVACAEVAATYDLTRVDLDLAAQAASMRARKRTGRRAVMVNARYLLDLLAELRATAHRRAH